MRWNVSISNQECKARPSMVNINSGKPLFHAYSVTANNRSGSCNDVLNAYVKSWAPDIVKNMNTTVFHLMSRTNEKHQIP